jgi:hypothetical protein
MLSASSGRNEWCCERDINSWHGGFGGGGSSKQGRIVILAVRKDWDSVLDLDITSRSRPVRVQSLLIWTGLDGSPFKRAY